MAKLKKTYFALASIYVLANILGIIGIAGFVFTVISYLNGGLYTSQALMYAISGISGYVSLSGLYYIVKAACLFIEKEESAE